MRKLLAVVALLLAVVASGAASPAPEPPSMPYVVVEGDVTFEMVERVDRDLRRLASDQPTLVLINTPGGSYEAGVRIARLLERQPGGTNCVVAGEAASMGFYILQSCGARGMFTNALLMTHEPFLVVREPTVYSLQDLRQQLRESELVAAEFAQHCVSRMNISMERYIRSVSGRDWVMGPVEALYVGAVDYTIDAPGKPPN